MTKAELKKVLWQKHTEAHRVHHKIADFILTKDAREHPPGLRNLVKKYLAMMDEYEAFETETANGYSQDQSTNSLPPALLGLLQSLPNPSVGWLQSERDKFNNTFGTLLDFYIPIVKQKPKFEDTEE